MLRTPLPPVGDSEPAKWPRVRVDPCDKEKETLSGKSVAVEGVINPWLKRRLWKRVQKRVLQTIRPAVH